MVADTTMLTRVKCSVNAAGERSTNQWRSLFAMEFRAHEMHEKSGRPLDWSHSGSETLYPRPLVHVS